MSHSVSIGKLKNAFDAKHSQLHVDGLWHGVFLLVPFQLAPTAHPDTYCACPLCRALWSMSAPMLCTEGRGVGGCSVCASRVHTLPPTFFLSVRLFGTRSEEAAQHIVRHPKKNSTIIWVLSCLRFPSSGLWKYICLHFLHFLISGMSWNQCCWHYWWTKTKGFKLFLPGLSELLNPPYPAIFCIEFLCFVFFFLKKIHFICTLKRPLKLSNAFHNILRQCDPGFWWGCRGFHPYHHDEWAQLYNSPRQWNTHIDKRLWWIGLRRHTNNMNTKKPNTLLQGMWEKRCEISSVTCWLQKKKPHCERKMIKMTKDWRSGFRFKKPTAKIRQ